MDTTTTCTDPRLRDMRLMNVKADCARWTIPQINEALVQAHSENRRATFENVVFRDLNLFDVEFSGALFVNCEFRDCNLSMARFKKAALYQVSFYTCALEYARFNDAFLQAVVIDNCNIEGTRFEDAATVYSRFSDIRRKPTGVNFDRATFWDSSFTGCSIERASFVGTELIDSHCNSLRLDCCELDNTLFERCELDGVSIESSNVERVSFTNCSFKTTPISVCGITRSSMRDSSMTNCKFQRFMLDGSVIYRTHFTDCKSDIFSAEKTVIVHCDFSGSFLSGKMGARFIGCNFDRARIEAKSNYSAYPTEVSSPYGLAHVNHLDSRDPGKFILGPNVNMSGLRIGQKDTFTLLRLNLSGADFSGCRVMNMDLKNSLFKHANFQGAEFRGVELCDVDFSGANFTGVTFGRADEQRENPDCTTNFLLAGSPRGLLVPVVYNAATVWPEGFQSTEMMATEQEISRAYKAAQDTLQRAAPTSDGIVFLPSPHERCSFTYLYAIFPDLFEVCGRFAVATLTASIAEQAMQKFAKAVRKDDAGGKLDNFAQKLEFTLAAMSESLTPSVIRAFVETKAKPVEALVDAITAHVATRRRANKYAAKKEAQKCLPEAL